jgi:hypothetical protein
MGFRRFLLSFFGTGQLPHDGRRFVESEGGRIVLESLDCSITFHNYRAPWKYSLWRRKGFLGSLALTNVRIVAYGFDRRIVNIPFADRIVHAVDFSVPRADIFQISFESSLFSSDRSGKIDLRFMTTRAEDVLAMLQSLSRPTGDAR